ncbi:hypothetical protein JMF89_10480 [Clostridiaceae bacterium UIB06]|uniref:Uncharacterized protein n=1 Tax=Clostridium thailandense TaxID=2794346 RepID=A0A949WSA8_9CLOT|nr:hypothetical protein [Clostridium thailandense]MBV7274881.1 hypothetical protein [Clostridium thailandense]MCH5137627.1 hypothetical protein [Clostridiaceae bacterium UIB06]
MYTILLSLIILGIFIVCGSIILGRYILDSNKSNEIGTYQMIKIDEKSIVILDTRTGQYWRKPIVENSSVKTISNETDNYR